jgi:F-box/WD-40 domain protein 7
VWNRRTNTAWAALTLAGHSGTVRCLHLYGNRLVSGSSDRTIKVWDLATNNVGWLGATCRATMIGHQHTVRCLQVHVNDNNNIISPHRLMIVKY